MYPNKINNMRFLQIKLSEEDANTLQKFADQTKRKFKSAGEYLLLEKLNKLRKEQ